MSATERRVDVVVIGAGPAGETAAGRIGDGGLVVALVERELVGGECSYWGCIPSKVADPSRRRPGRGPLACPARRRRSPARSTSTAALAKRDETTSSWHDDGQLPWLEEPRRPTWSAAWAGSPASGRSRSTAGDGAVHPAAWPGGRSSWRPARGARHAARSPACAEAAPWDNRDVTAMPGRCRAGCSSSAAARSAWRWRRPFTRARCRRGHRASRGSTALLGPRGAVRRRGGARRRWRPRASRSSPARRMVAADASAVAGGPVVGDARRTAGRFVGDEILVAVGRRPSTGDLGLGLASA